MEINLRMRVIRHCCNSLKKAGIVAGSIAARGIDVQELSHVFNFDIPNEAKEDNIVMDALADGRQGCAIAFSDCNEAEYVKNIEKLIRMHIPVVEDREFPMRNLEPAASAQSQNRRRQKPAAKPSVSNRSENRSAALKTQTSAATPKRNNRRRRPQSQKQPAHTA